MTPTRTTVPAGMVLRTGYVQHGRVRFAHYRGISMQAVEKYHREIIDRGGSDQSFNCPHGEWEGETFVVYDGRHRFTAHMIAGFDSVLVSWLEDEPAEIPAALRAA